MITVSRLKIAAYWWSTPSWHSDVVTTLSQCRGWCCHNVVAWSKMRVVVTSVSGVATSLLQRCHNIKHLVSRPFYYGQFWFFSRHRNVRELQKYWSIESSLWQARRTLVNSWLCLLLVCEQDKEARLSAEVAMKGLRRRKKSLQHNIVEVFRIE